MERGSEGRLRRGQRKRRGRCTRLKALTRKHYKKWSSALNAVEQSSESTTRTLTNRLGPEEDIGQSQRSGRKASLTPVG